MASEGWTWGSALDETAKTHPDLVAWGELSEAARERNVAFVANLIAARKLG